MSLKTNSTRKLTNSRLNSTNALPIITSGLTLYLDAANLNSYSGSGTTWYDLSGNNNNGTLTNGPTFSSINGGVIVFDGSNDRIQSFPTQISGVGSKTVCAVIYPTSTIRMGVCGIRNGSDGWVFTINRTTAGNLTYFHTTGTTVEAAAGISANLWNYVCVTYSTSAATVKLYKNGAQVGSTATGVSSIVASTSNGVIGDEELSVGTPFAGRMAMVHIYNRDLSDSEIVQNFNALKTRFGL